MYSVWTYGETQTEQFCKEEEVYARIYSKCNAKCPKKKITTLNKEMAIEAKEVNRLLDYKEAFITAKLDYLYKIWQNSDFPMSRRTYEDKFKWFLAHDMKCTFGHVDDHKFRHSSQKYQTFHCNYQILMNVLNKEENSSLKEFIMGPAGMDFKFTETYKEGKQEFSIYHYRQITRTEKNSNIEYENVFTSIDEAMKYSLGFEYKEGEKEGEEGEDQPVRMPLRDPFRM